MKDFLKIPLILLALQVLVGCSKDPEIDPISYLDPKGVTIKCNGSG